MPPSSPQQETEQDTDLRRLRSQVSGLLARVAAADEARVVAEQACGPINLKRLDPLGQTCMHATFEFLGVLNLRDRANVLRSMSALIPEDAALVRGVRLADSAASAAARTVQQGGLATTRAATELTNARAELVTLEKAAREGAVQVTHLHKDLISCRQLNQEHKAANDLALSNKRDAEASLVQSNKRRRNSVLIEDLMSAASAHEAEAAAGELHVICFSWNHVGYRGNTRVTSLFACLWTQHTYVWFVQASMSNNGN